MRLWILLIAISAAALVAFVPSAGAIDDCPLPNAAAGTNFGTGCDPAGRGPRHARRDVSTTPAATVGSPAWNDENLTYTVQVATCTGRRPMASIVGETPLGERRAGLEGRRQRSCTGMTCNLGSIAASATTVTS